MTDAPFHFRQQVPLKTYGDGGFRFDDYRHLGGIISLPSGIYRWDYQTIESLELEAFDRVINEPHGPDYLILGTGERRENPSPEITKYLLEKNIWLEVMDTGAAARTLNVLLAEDRLVGAALMPVGAHQSD